LAAIDETYSFIAFRLSSLDGLAFQGHLDFQLLGTTMNQRKSGNRIIFIRRPAPSHEKTDHREPLNQRASSQRIIVIRDGKFVSGCTSLK
jgi:hypothetical protein